jgi:hypothetical protein
MSNRFHLLLLALLASSPLSEGQSQCAMVNGQAGCDMTPDCQWCNATQYCCPSSQACAPTKTLPEGMSRRHHTIRLPHPKAGGPSEVTSLSFNLLSLDVSEAQPMVLNNDTAHLWTGTWGTRPPAAINSAVQSMAFVEGFSAKLDVKTKLPVKLNGTVTYDDASESHHVQLNFFCNKDFEGALCEVESYYYTKDDLKAFSTFVGEELIFTATFGAPTSDER